MPSHHPDLKIAEVKAYPTSVPVKPEDSVSRAVKRRHHRQAHHHRPVGGTAAQITEHIRNNVAQWGKVVKATGTRVE